jgi:hypothetical protein
MTLLKGEKFTGASIMPGQRQAIHGVW